LTGYLSHGIWYGLVIDSHLSNLRGLVSARKVTRYTYPKHLSDCLFDLVPAGMSFLKVDRSLYAYNSIRSEKRLLVLIVGTQSDTLLTPVACSSTGTRQ